MRGFLPINISLLGELRLKELVLVDIVRDYSAWYNITFVTGCLICVGIPFEDAIKIGWLFCDLLYRVWVFYFVAVEKILLVLIKQKNLVVVDTMVQLIRDHLFSLELNAIMLCYHRVVILGCIHPSIY